MAKEFTVSIPFAGYMSKTVIANSEKEAKEKFYEAASDIRFEIETLEKMDGIEWEFYEKLVQGNVCYTYYTQMEIEEGDEVINEDVE